MLSTCPQFALGNVAADELAEALLYAEAYMVRQMPCGQVAPTPPRKVMDVIGKFDRSYGSRDLLTELQASVWPTDDEIKDIAHEKPAYTDLGARPMTAILRGSRLSKAGRAPCSSFTEQAE